MVDLAWPVFIIASAVTLVAGGRVRRISALTRFGLWALGYCVVAAVAVGIAIALGAA